MGVEEPYRQEERLIGRIIQERRGVLVGGWVPTQASVVADGLPSGLIGRIAGDMLHAGQDGGVARLT